VPLLLTCEREEVNISVNATGSSSTFTYDWQTQNGNISSPNGLSNIEVNEAGEYTVLVTDVSNGCSNQTIVNVEEDKTLPTAVAVVNDLITCENLQVIIDGNGSSMGTNYTYLWNSNNGIIQSGSSGLNPVVSSPGNYELEVHNIANGCSNTTLITVQSDSLHPEAIILPPSILTCIDSLVALEVNITNAVNNVNYSWSTNNGNIIGNANTASIDANETGLYVVQVQNLDNGCYIEIDQSVAEDRVLPIVEAGEMLELNCTDTIVTLIGSASTNDGNFSTFWSTNNGQIISGATNLTAQADQPGIYTLWITDEVNGCINSDEVEVVEDPNILTAVSPRTTEPKCFGEWGAVEVIATAGGTPPYQYSLNNGQSFQSSAFFNLLDAGQYELLVVDAKGCEATAAFSIPQLQQNAVSLTPPDYRYAGR
jgi:hypothetical protein